MRRRSPEWRSETTLGGTGVETMANRAWISCSQAKNCGSEARALFLGLILCGLVRGWFVVRAFIVRALICCCGFSGRGRLDFDFGFVGNSISARDDHRVAFLDSALDL